MGVRCVLVVKGLYFGEVPLDLESDLNLEKKLHIFGAGRETHTISISRIPDIASHYLAMQICIGPVRCLI